MPEPSGARCRRAGGGRPCVRCAAMSRCLMPVAARLAALRSPVLAVALLALLGQAPCAAAAGMRTLDRFAPAATSGPTLRTDGERFAAWERPRGRTVIFDVRRPGRTRTVPTPAGYRLAAVGGGRVLWELATTFATARPTSSSVIAAEAAAGEPGSAVRFIATYGSGPLCPQAGAAYGGITDAGTAGVVVTCQRAVAGEPWRFSVDPTTGTSTAPRFAPAELAGRVWDWNADVAGIQVLACDSIERAPGFAASTGAAGQRGPRPLAYESPFGATPRWDAARGVVRPGAQLLTCGRRTPLLLERSGAPTAWQFGGTTLSWLTERARRPGERRVIANLFDLRRARFQRRANLILPRRANVAAGHVAGRLLVQVVRPGPQRERRTSTVRSYRAG